MNFHYALGHIISLNKLRKTKKQTILDKLENERNVSGFDSKMEDIRALNFMSYMSFAVGKFDNVLKYNSVVLEMNGQNINALVIKAWYHCCWLEFEESSEQCFLLETLKTNELEMLYA